MARWFCFILSLSQHHFLFAIREGFVNFFAFASSDIAILAKYIAVSLFIAFGIFYV